MLPRIAILLATCNGEKYLAEQLDSLLDQTHDNLVVLIRDDGSNDGTPALINSYVRRYPDRIQHLADDAGRLGAGACFARLIEHALENKSRLELEPAYLCFADQDDVWVSDKLFRNLAALQTVEQGGRIPSLVHSDLMVVDRDLEQIAPSLIAYQGLQPEQHNFGRSLVANAVTGCTVMINEALARLAVPVPSAAVMHDWWLALVAEAFGRIVFIDAALVQYRQHGLNTLGARAAQPADRQQQSLITRALDTSSRLVFTTVAQQSREFRERYQRHLTRRQRILCRLAGCLRYPVPPVQKLLYRLLRRI